MLHIKPIDIQKPFRQSDSSIPGNPAGGAVFSPAETELANMAKLNLVHLFISSVTYYQ